MKEMNYINLEFELLINWRYGKKTVDGSLSPAHNMLKLCNIPKSHDLSFLFADDQVMASASMN